MQIAPRGGCRGAMQAANSRIRAPIPTSHARRSCRPLLRPGALRRGRRARRHRRAQAVRAARRAQRGGAHAGRAGAACRASPRRWSCWRPTTRSSSARAGLRRPRAGSRAAAARRAPQTVAGGLAAAARARRAAPTTGCWCTTPRAAWCARSGSTALIDACLDDDVGGLLALPLADTLKRRARRPRRRHASTAPTSGRRRRRRCSASACCATRWRAAGAGVTDEASAIEALGLRRCWCAAALENFKLTWPADFELAERLLRTTP